MDASVWIDWRSARHWRVLADRELHRVTAGDSRCPRTVAIHTDVRRHSGNSPDLHPPVSARVPGMAGEEGRWNAAAPERCRPLHTRVPPDDDRDDDHVCVQLWRGVWRHSANAAADRAGVVRRTHTA